MATNEKLSKLLEKRQVDSVRQRGADLDIDFTDGSTLSLKLSAATGAISLAKSDDTKEYGG